MSRVCGKNRVPTEETDDKNNFCNLLLHDGDAAVTALCAGLFMLGVICLVIYGICGGLKEYT